MFKKISVVVCAIICVSFSMTGCYYKDAKAEQEKYITKDYKNAETITREMYDKIEIGSNVEQVLEQIGRKPYSRSQEEDYNNGKLEKFENISWLSENGRDLYVFDFKDGKLEDKFSTEDLEKEAKGK